MIATMIQPMLPNFRVDDSSSCFRCKVGSLGRILAAFLILCCSAWPIGAQEAAPPPDPAPSTEVEPTTESPAPVSLADIPADRAAFEGQVREIRRRLEDRSALESARDSFEQIDEKLASIPEAAGFESAQQSEISDLLYLDTTAVTYANDLDEAESTLNGLAMLLAGDLNQLDGLRERWNQLQRAAASRDAPDSLLQQIDETFTEIDELSAAVEEQRNEVLSLLVEVSDSTSRIAAFRADAAAYRRQMRLQSVTQAERPIWEIRLGSLGDDLPQHLLSKVQSDGGHLASYIRDNAPRLTLIFVGFFGGTLLPLLRLKRPAEHLAAEDPVAERALAVISPGWPLALLVALFATLSLAPAPAPEIFYRLLRFLLPLPAAALAIRVLGGSFRTSILIVAGALALFPLRPYFELSPLLDRLVLLGQCLAVGTALAVDIVRGLRLPVLQERWRPARLWLIKAAIALLAISILAAIIGQIGTARALRDGVTGSLGFGLVFITLFIALDSLFMTWIQTGFAQSLNLVKVHGPTIERFVRRLLAVVGGLAWLYSTIFAFGLKDDLPLALEKVLGLGVSVRAVEITLGEVLSFVGIVALSFLLARVVCFFLDEEFLPRLHLQRGLPYAISTVVRYVILLSGFSLALVAAGLDLSKATLLAGAFGVGIGFGLQNVVNNFVSGLILLFERPIQVGDTVEVESLMGEVTRIGIRASTVATFQGAEVIVPNGDLISKQVVNWTLSNRRRRVEIDVGVAYGSSPEEVIEILLGTARQHPDVSADPESVVVFTGFGDSSLDFQLKCWVARFELALSVASELRVAVNRALAEAGIEIPFPQRDINVRSEAGDPVPFTADTEPQPKQDPEENSES